jgi:hypothetical protein
MTQPDELIRRALKAYGQACSIARKRGHAAPKSPAHTAHIRTTGGKTYAVVRGQPGSTLMVYRLLNNGELRGLKRWPRELDYREGDHEGGVGPLEPLRQFEGDQVGGAKLLIY